MKWRGKIHYGMDWLQAVAKTKQQLLFNHSNGICSFELKKMKIKLVLISMMNNMHI